MKRAQRLMRGVLVIGWCMLAGCGHDSGGSSPQAAAPSVDQDYQRSKDAALAQAKREYEEALTNPPPRQIPLPNFMAGPGLPPPIALNFYETRRYHPGYLLCTYDVDEKHYDPANEPAWFKASLLQIRGTGRDSFPPFKWIAVIINNRADWKGLSTIDQAHKVGAIFNASDVFDRSRDLTELVAQAKLDRHPFSVHPTQPTPGQQDRWLIVERHAAANPLAASSN